MSVEFAGWLFIAAIIGGGARVLWLFLTHLNRPSDKQLPLTDLSDNEEDKARVFLNRPSRLDPRPPPPRPSVYDELQGTRARDYEMQTRLDRRSEQFDDAMDKINKMGN